MAAAAYGLFWNSTRSGTLLDAMVACASTLARAFTACAGASMPSGPPLNTANTQSALSRVQWVPPPSAGHC